MTVDRGKRGTGRKASRIAKRAQRLGHTCPHCSHDLNLDGILFIEDGVYSAYQVREEGASLGFELDEIGGDADSYFACRYCGEPLQEISELWRSGKDKEIIELLGSQGTEDPGAKSKEEK